MPTKTYVTQPSLENHVQPMWEVERAPAPDGSRMLRLGTSRFSVSEIARVKAHIEQTRHRHGRVVSMILFGVLASYFMVGVFQFNLERRFLFAAFICAALALMSMEDVIFSRPQRLAVFDIRLKDGRRVRWSTASEAEAAALNAVLTARA